MSFCYKTAVVWQVIGYVFFILKIVIPMILIILGIIDFGKAVLSSDDKSIKDAAMTLAKRLIAGVIIFFIPTVINVVFSYISGFSEDMQADAMNCINCLTSPNGSCDTSYEGEVFPTGN